MKIIIKTVVIALIAVIGFSMTVCDINLGSGGGGGGTGGSTTYTVTYNANGGTGGTVPVDSTAYTGGATVTVKGNTGILLKADHTFAGWNTAANGSGTAYQSGATFTINANTTLYAQWVSDDMVWIPAGTFTMGSPANEPNRGTNETQHSVTLTAGFWMGKYEVTQEKYLSVTGYNPSNFSGNNLPVEMVTWYDALVFCNKLSMAEGLTPAYTISGSTDPAAWGTVPVSSVVDATWNAAVCNWSANGYRLPTEAEWEYACRAGTTTAFNWGTNQIADTQANFRAYGGGYNGSPTGVWRNKTTEVGTFAPNAWGLYDMHGNVFEWCWDWYDTYPAGAQTDPRGAVSGTYRVLRGGSWYDYGRYLRSAYRNVYYLGNGDDYWGLRLVRL